MKKILFTFFTIIGLTLSAQQEAPPQGINYQAVVYSDNGNNQPGLNNPGQVLWNKDITLRFAVYQGEDNPILVYEELHAITTDEFGMVSLVIGNGVPQGTQLFETINWGGGSHFLRVDVDKNAGVNFAPMSYQKLWSVPYALYSEQSNSSNYSDSSDYSNIAGNGITGVTDNGDGTLTFTYFDGSVYTTAVLSGMEGPQGEIGPEGPAGIDGQDGLSAYEVWISQGNTGTEQDFLNGVIGPQGPAGNDGVNGIDGQNGQDGLSAYETWLSQGNTGTEADFLNGITGPQGPVGTNGVDGTNGQDGQDGSSAYEIWLAQGNTGTEADFINGITGPAGNDGVDGVDGLSAYEVWLAQGNTGTEADFLNGIAGPQGSAGVNGIDGADGLSAYEVWLAQGNTGTEADFINGITGPAGNDGVDGADGLSAYEVWLAQGNTGSEADFLTGITGPQGIPGVGVAQTISQTGNIATLSDGGGTININDTDSDSSNEFQTLSLSNDTLYISDGNSVYLEGLSEEGSGGSSPVGTISYPMANHMFYTPTTGYDGELVVAGNQTMDGIYNLTKFHLDWTGTIDIGPKAFLLIKADTVIIDGIIDGVGLNTGDGTGGGSGGGGGNSISACFNCSGTDGFPSSNGYFDQIVGGAGGPVVGNIYNAGSPGFNVDSTDLLTFIDLNTTLKGARGGRWCGDPVQAGGNGGGGVIIVADYYTSSFTSSINVNGANGVNASAGGGGGGSIVVKSNNFGPIDGTYSTFGGNGRAWSNCWGPAGKGGDGMVLFITP